MYHDGEKVVTNIVSLVKSHHLKVIIKAITKITNGMISYDKLKISEGKREKCFWRLFSLSNTGP